MRGASRRAVEGPHLFLLALLALCPGSDAVVAKRAAAVPAVLPGTWQYEGCYTDVGRTINEAAFADNVAMTVEACLNFCAAQGFKYAGTEYYQECYCGRSLAPAAAPANEADCSYPCTGNAGEACGGANRLSLFYNPAAVGPQPNPGVNGWEYVGCYAEGTTGRALTHGIGSIPGGEMTVAKCTTACRNEGYFLAGVEYSGECYCDNVVRNGGGPANADSCNMLCHGNSSEFCGGPNRLNLYEYLPVHSSSSSSVPPTLSTTSISSTTSSSTTSTTSTSTSTTTSTTTSTPTSTTSSTSTTTSTSTSTTSSTSTTTSTPTSTTSSTSTTTTSMSTSTTSSTSPMSTTPTTSSTSSTTTAITSTSSTTPSSASSGPSTTSTTSTTLTTSSTTSTSSAVPTGPIQPAAVGTWQWYGCRTEGAGIRALNAAMFFDDVGMTLEKCAAFCAGYTYFGTEYAQECFCGNSFNTGSVPAPATDCNYLCKGNALTFCGAGNRLSVYSSNGSQPPSLSSSTAPSTTPSASSTASTVASSVASSVTSSTSTSTTTLPVPTGMPAGWTYQGCWIDGAHGRAFTYQVPDSADNSPATCANSCKDAGYAVSGTEYGVQCFCGKWLINGAIQTSNAECNMACPGAPAEKCGDGNRLSVYSSVGAPQAFAPPAPQQTGLDGDWTYQGCVQDNVGNKRTFPWQLMLIDTMSPNECLNQCALFGYAAGGLEYGHECYCGDPANMATRGANFVDESLCSLPCEGLPSSMCGGLAVMTTYFWTGVPLYGWDIPQSPAGAGQYEFLVDGMTVPLMTMQSVTGKVSFVSKGPGTVLGNETGAYELDLTLTNTGNYRDAWRTLHLKTDLFCAAGVILPDKVGRQMNVGGWAGASTYGMRLYWPDGSNGVWGTNDWEENVQQLSLQNGRWYPSAMIMANGSVMVIGGEDGANGNEVPTIEVLPYTGTAPVSMDWLERTDPNNLYPFINVLPGGGIFVGYWNEARILDESTFATIKTLPNMPGAVNDPLAGRTYPLEGTMVLLPQKAPYTEPLGLLICGGSTIGAGNALDNCVSIRPEAAEPEWVLERMPSPRVMPCIAPLPDGTYLVANGAVQGVAGFGLANSPNLNAILYDPEKPVNHRFTIMANTTIARLYHSEAITLLDGRVLISGSDPGNGGIMPEEYRVEVFIPPYLLTGKPRPSFTIVNKDWAYGQVDIPFTLGHAAQNGAITVSLLGAVSSTHGNSMGARTLMPAFSCTGTACKVTAPPGPHICPPGWYQLHVLDGGVPAVGTYVRIGGDPAELGNWPPGDSFSRPGL